MTTRINHLLKGLYAVCIMAFVIGFTSLTVRAETTDEIESNDTMETAQSIMANRETAVDFANGTFWGQHIIKGYTSNSDEDWFVVNLKSGDNYLTCNCSTFNFAVIDSNGNYIKDGTYLDDGMNMEAFRLNIPSDGYYYVKIKGVTSTPRDYLFLIGGPTYLISSTTIRCSSGMIRMTSKGGVQKGIFDGKSVAFPRDSVVYYIRVRDLRSTDVKKIKLYNNYDPHTLNLDNYTWDKRGIIGLNMSASARWTAEFTYSKNTTFTPSLYVEFIYPVYSTPVDPRNL